MSEAEIIRDTLVGYVAGLAARPLTVRQVSDHACGLTPWLEGYYQGVGHRVAVAIDNRVSSYALRMAMSGRGAA